MKLSKLGNGFVAISANVWVLAKLPNTKVKLKNKC